VNAQHGPPAMQVEDQVLPPYSTDYLRPRRGHIKLTGPDDEIVGYLVQENKWSKDKDEALLFEIPPVGFTSEQTPQPISVVGGKQEGPWVLGVIGPRNRRHSRFRPAREAKESWSFNTHAMSTLMLNTEVFACKTDCWVMFGDELRLVWEYEDETKALVKALKLKDRATAGNLAFRDSTGSRDVPLKLVFEEEELGGSGSTPLSRPVSKNKIDMQQQASLPFANLKGRAPGKST